MNSLSIAQLAQFSGIKAHTIRIWEQRYHALKPERTEGNTRFYSGMDLKRLLNIVSLIDQYKVSELCRLNDKGLNSLVEKVSSENKNNSQELFISQLIAAGIEFNEPSFQKILSHCFLRYGMAETYKTIIYPALNRMGLMWRTDQLPTAHEHFISNMIRQKLLTVTDSLALPKENAKKWILFLPEDEHHEIGLLMAQYLLRLRGEKVYYLGANVPVNTLFLASKIIKPDALLLFFVHNNFKEDVDAYLSDLSKNCKHTNIYISGNEKLISTIDLKRQVNWLKTLEDLEKAEK